MVGWRRSEGEVGRIPLEAGADSYLISAAQPGEAPAGGGAQVELPAWLREGRGALRPQRAKWRRPGNRSPSRMRDGSNCAS
jgi:hypothetical protein